MYTDSNGISKGSDGWAKVAGIRPVTMRKRLRDLGWSVERAISEPVRQQVENPDRAAANALARARSAEHLAAVASMLRMIKRTPCTDCGKQHDPEVMEFDHVPERGKKSFALSDAAGRRLATIVAEIAKCDLVCANCHRRRTKSRRQLESLNL